eukprot:1194720-Prorocentrum_minimum.AAC.5
MQFVSLGTASCHSLLGDSIRLAVGLCEVLINNGHLCGHSMLRNTAPLTFDAIIRWLADYDTHELGGVQGETGWKTTGTETEEKKVKLQEAKSEDEAMNTYSFSVQVETFILKEGLHRAGIAA